ncbi:MAG: (Fe-S)-binding protein [Candidatus Heimdallarchaeota archaeon]|nr:MAG: (Fe-S)-binding protein [Candidatus Heimdallarchaeota archaeon]
MINSDIIPTSVEISDEGTLSIIKDCFQCGLCTSVCPLRKVSKYNPRGIIHSALLGHSLNNDDLTICLTCSQCFEGCPQEIDFPAFIRESRANIILGEENFAHHNIFNLLQIFMAQMTESGMNFSFEGDSSSESDIAYFPGCIDLFDRFLDLKTVKFHDIGQSAINVINKVGIKPNILSLKCCGHDAYWTGDNDSFDKVRDYNTQVIKSAEIKTLIVSCAECYYTFKQLYELDSIKVQHISQFIEEHQEKLEYKDDSSINLTYHDPCRLGRFMREYESPRNVLKKSGTSMTELLNNRENTSCCGVSAWLRCDDQSRAIMLKKLEEATQAVGNEGTLVVGCNKCYAHLNCVLEDKKPQHQYQLQVKELGMIIDELSVKK